MTERAARGAVMTTSGGADARVAFVTCAGRPALQPDDALAAAVLARRGIRVEPLPWNAAGPPPGAFDLVVLRSTWDYHLSPERFVEWLAWVEASGVPVLNPPERVRWNLSKRYLAELEAAGVPVVPTRWLDAGAAAELADLARELKGDGVVVKPQVSASAFGTWRAGARPDAAEQARFAGQLREEALLVQPFVPDVAAVGEWSLVFLGGAYSHAVLKRPAAGDFRVQYELGGTFAPAAPPAALVEMAADVVARAASSCVYARVDVLPRGDAFLLGELELIEPHLFLGCEARAAERFADAIAAALRAGAGRAGGPARRDHRTAAAGRP